MLCLLPSAGDAVKDGADSSDDSIDEKTATKKGNLEPAKSIEAYIRVAKQAVQIGAKPAAKHVIRQSKKEKPIRK